MKPKIKKYNAIEKLVKHGCRNSEWAEAGLLHAIEEVIDSPDDTNWTSDKIKSLIERARKN